MIRPILHLPLRPVPYGTTQRTGTPTEDRLRKSLHYVAKTHTGRFAAPVFQPERRPTQ